MSIDNTPEKYYLYPKLINIPAIFLELIKLVI